MDPAVDIRVEREAEASRGWDFDIRLGTTCAGEPRSGRIIRLRLAWADYEHWSGGRLTPEEVAVAVVRCAIATLGADAIPDRNDAAIFRRTSPGFDERLIKHLPR